MDYFDKNKSLHDLLLYLKTKCPEFIKNIKLKNYSNTITPNILPYDLGTMTFNKYSDQPLLAAAIDNNCMEAIDAILWYVARTRDTKINFVTCNTIIYCSMTNPEIFDFILDKIIVNFNNSSCNWTKQSFNKLVKQSLLQSYDLDFRKTTELIKSYGKSKCIDINLLYDFCFENLGYAYFSDTCYECCPNIDWTQQNNKFIKNLKESPFGSSNNIFLIKKIILNQNTKAYLCIPQINKSFIPYLFVNDIHQYEKLIHKLIYEQHAHNHLKLCIISDMFLNYNSDAGNVIKKLLSFVMEHDLKKYLLQQNNDIIFHNV